MQCSMELVRLRDDDAVIGRAQNGDSPVRDPGDDVRDAADSLDAYRLLAADHLRAGER